MRHLSLIGIIEGRETRIASKDEGSPRRQQEESTECLPGETDESEIGFPKIRKGPAKAGPFLHRATASAPEARPPRGPAGSGSNQRPCRRHGTFTRDASTPSGGPTGPDLTRRPSPQPAADVRPRIGGTRLGGGGVRRSDPYPTPATWRGLCSSRISPRGVGYPTPFRPPSIGHYPCVQARSG
jgi:hypothetical protein